MSDEPRGKPGSERSAGAAGALDDGARLEQAEGEPLVDELRRAHEQLRAELDATSRLLRIGSLFIRKGDPQPVLGEIVDAAIAISGADFGNIQLLDRASGDLVIAAHRGFPDWWVEYWDRVGRGRGACGTALERRERVIVEDVERSPIFAGTPGLALQLEAHVRAVQSTPLLSRAGEPIGMLSTHYRRPRKPGEHALRRLDLLARQAADIVERARAEEKLRNSERRFRALVDASSEALYRMSPDWSEMHQLHSRGFLADTEATSTTWLHDYIPADEQGRVRAAIDDAIRTGGVFELEHRVVRADGSPGWTFSRAVPIEDARGEIVEWFGAAADVTERKRAEEKLREVDRRKDEYMAMLGHELRNPLGAIRFAAELLLKHAGAQGLLVTRAIGVLERQSSHMSRIIDGLLDVSRIARGKIQLVLAPVDVRDVVDKVLEVQAPHIAARGLALDADVGPEPLWIAGDDARLAQVFDNLVGNAVKFTPPPGTITVAVDREDGSAVVRVRDTGAGIRPEVLATMFEPFQQGPRDAARSTDGLGLGLALARGLVELHHGTIEARSGGPGTGAELVVRLPLAAAPGAREAGAPEAVLRRRILVVEDHDDAAQVLRDLLEVSGHEVTVTGSGREALAALRGRGVDVVLCDLALPEMSGYELARAIRADGALRDIPLVAMTGYGQPEDRQRSAEAGFDDHLVKPVQGDAIDRVLVRLGRGRPEPR